MRWSDTCFVNTRTTLRHFGVSIPEAEECKGYNCLDFLPSRISFHKERTMHKVLHTDKHLELIFLEVYFTAMDFLESEWRFRPVARLEGLVAELWYRKYSAIIHFAFDARDVAVSVRMHLKGTAIPDVFPPEAFPEAYSRIQDPLFELFLRLPLREEYQQFFSKAERKRLEQLIELAVVQRDVEAARAVLEKEAEFHAYILRKYQPQILQVVEAASAESGEA
jgi:hypothetical protein